MNDGPLAYFITWTVYGTFLQGDQRWWRDRQKGLTKPQPKLEQWHRERLKHDVLLLTTDQRSLVESKIREHCEHRDWKLWIANRDPIMSTSSCQPKAMPALKCEIS